MAVTYGRDPDGRPTAIVPLSNDPRSVTLYRTDYDRVLAVLGPAKWFANANGWGNLYVRARLPQGGNVMVARLVANPESTVLLVRPRDRDPFNLRSTNLEKLRRGAGKRLSLAQRLEARAGHRRFR